MADALRVPRPQRPLRRFAALLLGCSLALPPAGARAEQCQVVDLDFTPADLTTGADEAAAADRRVARGPERQLRRDGLHHAARPARYGLGNRPGRFDFNSGPNWPYGRRITMFPVWAHRTRRGHRVAARPRVPDVVYQNGDENNLSHPFNQSSREMHYCRPLMRTEPAWAWRRRHLRVVGRTPTRACSAPARACYPPRADIAQTAPGQRRRSTMYTTMNPFDAISRRDAGRRHAGAGQLGDPVRDSPTGDYVMWIEVSREFDHNATYNPTAYPAADRHPVERVRRAVPRPAVGRLPGAVHDRHHRDARPTTATYVGYGDPDRRRRPRPSARRDDHRPTSPARARSASRSSPTAAYRVRVTARPEFDFAPPASPERHGDRRRRPARPRRSVRRARRRRPRRQGQGLRGALCASTARTSPRTTSPTAIAGHHDARPRRRPASCRRSTLNGLLPETEYTVGDPRVRRLPQHEPAHRRARSRPPSARVGEVDACFIATAAYGSLMANDVEMLRRFRDSMLQHRPCSASSRSRPTTRSARRSRRRRRVGPAARDGALVPRADRRARCAAFKL